MFWQEYLDNPTLSVLPHDFLKPANNQAVEASLDFPLAAPFVDTLAAFAALIYRLTGDDDIVIATDALPDTPLFVVRLRLTPELTKAQLVLMVHREMAHQEHIDYTSLLEVAERIRQARGLDAAPGLFRLLFQHARPGQQLLTTVEGLVRDMAVFFDEHTVLVHYNALLYKRERIAMLGEQLAAVVAAPDDLVITQVLLVTPGQQLLPDPTTDLDWLGYAGAIHDIFARNADAHPDRTCVVETGAVDRVFSYRQIHEASNVVGNYLKETGIAKGDIVMIYAHRGVDLMVAVMGVLKAGATFSVIDPAYPPARQNIYLQVARPQGLIVLAKAGELDLLVTDYIRDELSVVLTLNGLRLGDDGQLEGMEQYQHYAADMPGVAVGPDSNPTLSFTLGSEGIPKGVLGRHYLLAYYFPWMAERFGLLEHDKFTMLLGIAHDPIQRDMFTPLFLGAQLLIPTADDIGTPGQLAQWMATHGATVTHLTPAMGQLLLAEATAPIPLLHHAFFVGDILTKRDCLRLQLLAENVAIVNMYGTTETQRLVLYFEIALRADDATYLKNLKDVMPAGTGMKNVQLLVVNRNDRLQTCGVGEVGEIYVRAAGMAEGYRGLPELTAEKFVTNWFTGTPEDKSEPEWRELGWKGPRDRLYRTGDLGRYLPDGNVECCGRADDQVKIRGFRIELGEIDTHLLQHPHVRENVTLVRRDKNEEPVLVLYIVPRELAEVAAMRAESAAADPLVQGLVAYRALIADIKTFLKGRLASYAIPTLVVPLAKMPLNPNGKFDKPKLPFPDTVQLAAVAQAAPQDDGEWSALETRVREVWQQVLPSSPAVGKHDLFFDLGGHLILATRMIFELRKQLAVDVPLGVIFAHPQLEAFAAEVDRVVKGDDVLAPAAEEEQPFDYAADAAELARQLPESYPLRTELGSRINVFVTGATGFLGSFIVRDVLTARPGLDVRVYAHVRAQDAALGMARLRNAGKTFGIWDPAWEQRIEVVLGDLARPQFGMDAASWDKLTTSIDVVIHNGAFVHWVYDYERLRDANVVGTVNVLNMCATGKPKYFSFVLLTSALDTDYFVNLSDELVAQGGAGVPELDLLAGLAHGLGTGYGQSKWAAEHVIRAAGRRGLRGCITRPGYVTGFLETGASNTDDFLLRMLKGLVELGRFPDIANTVNMVPVDHVARVVVATALLPPQPEMAVAHVTGHPRLEFREFVGSLAAWYDVERTDYLTWRLALEKFVVDTGDLALFPLLHFVLDNLPQNTKAPELDDSNARASLKLDAGYTGVDVSAGRGVTVDQMAIYVAYLVRIGFLPAPAHGTLPAVDISAELLALIEAGAGGRGLAAK